MVISSCDSCEDAVHGRKARQILQTLVIFLAKKMLPSSVWQIWKACSVGSESALLQQRRAEPLDEADSRMPWVELDLQGFSFRVIEALFVAMTFSSIMAESDSVRR
jgi:hypothetical protein